jgi:hypothetical protein
MLDPCTSGKKFAIVVGINHYAGATFGSQRNAESSAKAIGRTLNDRGFQVTPILGSDATRENILNTLAKQDATLSAGDQLFFYFAGNTVSLGAATGPRNFLVPYGARFDDLSPATLGSWIGVSDLTTRQSSKGTNTLYVVAQRFGDWFGMPAGNRTSQQISAAPEFGGLGHYFFRSSSVGILAASYADQMFENQERERVNSFTSAIIDAMQGAADKDADGRVGTKELFEFVHERTASSSITPHLIEAEYTNHEEFAVGAVCGELYPRAGRVLETAETVGAHERRRFALLIGTDDYLHWPPLSNPVHDINAIGEVLHDVYGFEVKRVPSPTHAEFSKALRVFNAKEFEADQLLIFIAGHGYYDEIAREGALVLKNSVPNCDLDKKTPENDWCFSQDVLRSRVNKLAPKQILLVVDACFSGTIDSRLTLHRGSLPGNSMSPHEIVLRAEKYKTRLFLTSGGKEYVSDGRPGHHSPFVRRLLDLLRKSGVEGRMVRFSNMVGRVEDLRESGPLHGEMESHEPGGDFLFVPLQNSRNAGERIPR